MHRRDTPTDDNTRAVAPVVGENRIVELPERENEFLRNQIAVKDKQIAEQQERAHETNTLINGLQRLIAPLLAAPNRGRNIDARSSDGIDGEVRE